MAEAMGSDDLEEDFQSFAFGNAGKDPDTDSLVKTGQGGTDQVDASASARTGLVRIIPGTLSEGVNRYKTFQKYGWDQINPFPKASDLSDAGFYYEGRGDTVTCQYCNLRLSNWEADDDPFAEHKKWSPKCPYIKQFYP